MQPVPRSMFLVINPSDSSGTANLAFGVSQDASTATLCRPTLPSAVGGASTPGAVSGVNSRPPTLSAARATLQAQLPPVRSGRMVAAGERRRMAAATSLIVAGCAGVATGIGMSAYVFATTTVALARAKDYDNDLTARIGGAIAIGIAGLGCIATGMSLLNVRSADAPVDVEAQIQRALPILLIPHVPVELQSIVVEPNVVEPNVVNTSASAAAPAAVLSRDR